MTPGLCPVCSSDQVDLYWPQVWQSPKQRVFRCQSCLVLFLWPMLGKEAVAELHVRFSEQIMRRTVTRHKETPEETYSRRVSQEHDRRRRLEPHIRSCRSALEIGGGCGNFIGELLKQGLVNKAALVDLCGEHREFARNTFPGLICAATLGELPPASFDTIFMFHVLEHVEDPVEFLTECGGLLSPGGRIMIEVPCSADPLLSLYDCAAYKNFYFQPMHPFVYHRQALSTLFRKTGLLTGDFIHLQRYSLSNHLQWLAHGRPGGNDKYSVILGHASQDTYREALEKNGTTDTLMAITGNCDRTHR